MAFIGWVLGDLISREFLPGKGWRIPLWKRFTESTTPTGSIREDTPVLANIRQEEEDEAATETRPLASQFLDTFRR
ncbi:hypothetical protein BON22_0673 [Cyberlindnera fabianii]|nr:hypothetical protein BON22_0673 [Cyberlindnera fabianii]